MMKDFLQQLLDASIISQFKEGSSPEDLRGAILSLFSPYMDNKEYFESRGWMFLINDAMEFHLALEDKRTKDIFELCMSVFQKAKLKDDYHCLQANSEWIPQIYESGSVSISWIQKLLDREVEIEDLHDYAYQGFQDVGIVLESILKPFIKLVYLEAKISRGEDVSLEEVGAFPLGIIVDDLIVKEEFGDFLAPKPWSVKISQWRNIAQHFDWRIEDKRIICTYGRKKDKQIELSKKDLHDLLAYLVMLTTAFRIAHRVFHIDNLFESNKFGLLPKDVKLRKETKDMSVYTMLASQGLEVLADRTVGGVRQIQIKNVLLEDDDSRRIELYQIARLFWFLEQTDQIEIEYFGKDNSMNYKIHYEKQILEKFNNGEIETSLVNLISHSKSEDLKYP